VIAQTVTAMHGRFYVRGVLDVGPATGGVHLAVSSSVDGHGHTVSLNMRDRSRRVSSDFMNVV
jgi:small ligand-binding sensory domain FIST